MSSNIIDPSGDFMDSPGNVISGGQIVQRVGNQYATAIGVQRQRDLDTVKRRVVMEATLAGESMYYSWSVKNSDGTKGAIEGPSINLAMTIARNFGNCVAGCVEEVEDTPNAWIFTGSFIDLETGFNFVRKFRQSKGSRVHMKTDDERKDDIRFQIGQSKAIRNAVIACVPSAIVEQAIAAAKSGVLKKIEKSIKDHSLAKVQDAAIDTLKKLGIDEATVLSRFNVAERKAISLEHLVMMHGDIRTIQDGVERAESLYPPIEKDANEVLKDKIKKPKAQEDKKEKPKEEEKAPEEKPKTEEVVDDQGEVEEVEKENVKPDWYDKRKEAYNFINQVDRMRLPLNDLNTEWKKASDADKVWWASLIVDASTHLLGMCNKVSVVPMAIKQLNDTLKGFDGLDDIKEKFEARQKELQG